MRQERITNYEKRATNYEAMPGLDASGSRYFEGWLAEAFADIGFQSAIGNPQSAMVVHGLNAWVCLEPQRTQRG